MRHVPHTYVALIYAFPIFFMYVSAVRETRCTVAEKNRPEYSSTGAVMTPLSKVWNRVEQQTLKHLCTHLWFSYWGVKRARPACLSKLCLYTNFHIQRSQKQHVRWTTRFAATWSTFFCRYSGAFIGSIRVFWVTVSVVRYESRLWYTIPQATLRGLLSKQKTQFTKPELRE